ncbi:VPS62 [Candida pseudojiufengensis]|uniref:VPS62 n=1 Tax=Candida pseudojiufengensis TaxID=497109 RepID=UPI0022259035|nr:VPS62 [Candida pseudojiufengensis]KAI5965907.1 VPS62 [Candida pseudojiufengensis]
MLSGIITSLSFIVISTLSQQISQPVENQQPNLPPYYDVSEGNNYILNTIQDDYKEIKISNILSNPLKYKDFPPIISLPKQNQRTLKPGEIPQYVIDYAPLVYLYSEERYLPYDIKEFVTNFHVTFKNGSIYPGTETDMNIEKLAQLKHSKKLYLTSNTNFDDDPDWITGIKNKPNLINGEIKNAPATLIVVDKGNGWVDAYWFYFYSFNLGPFVMGQGPYGNHVGDWEHSLVRFYKGEPIIVWMSAHGGGGAFYYHNLEKYTLDPRHPIIFSARGTHANYPSVGQHPHDLPYDILSDFTDRGPLWNPSKNYLGYTYDGKYVFPALNNSNPKYIGREWSYDNWLNYKGHWGDKQLPNADKRQTYSFIGGYKYIDGPTGPLRKNVLRIVPCERSKWWNFWRGCNVRQNIKWGVGVESEGYNCGNIFVKLKPRWLKVLLQKMTWGGGICYIVDLIYG